MNRLTFSWIWIASAVLGVATLLLAQTRPPTPSSTTANQDGTTGFPLAAPAGKDSNARGVAPAAAVNQGPFDPATWKYGPAFNSAADVQIWNPVKLKLLQGGKVTGGTLFSATDPATYCAMANAGYDFIWTEMQHSQRDWQDAARMWRTCPHARAVPGVRVAYADEREIQHALDAGALVVVVPTIDTVAEAIEARNWTYFPPLGRRSQGGGQAFEQGMWGGVPGGYRNTINDNIVLILMIETLEGLKNADEIASACEQRAAPLATPNPPMATWPLAAAPSVPTSTDPASGGGGYIPMPPGGPTPEWEMAVRLFRQANTLQFQSRLDEAIQAYQRSLAAFPTAEAYTFLGWTYAWQGRLEEAITEAVKAIELDPDYGNPYNDIGLYLIELGRLDEAAHWLHKAIAAKRYEERQFPHLNLGRIWTRKGLFEDAFAAFEKCFRAWWNPSLPDFPTVKVVIAATSNVSPPVWLLPELRKALNAYFHAWNTHNPEALIDASAPRPPEVTEALLQHLAHAKVRGARMTLEHLELLRFDDSVALVEATVQTDGTSQGVQYVLQRFQGVWKVMGPAVVDVEEVPPVKVALIS